MAVSLQRLQLPEVRRTGREELGRGSYAVVFEVMVQGTPCAAKEVHSILMSAKSKESFYAECVRSSQLLHPNIVQFMGIYYPNPRAELPWLVMELLYISLTGLIEQRVKESKDIPFHFKISILVDICQGLQFLHSKSIAHRDLSSNKILITKQLVAKIADLGMAKVMLADGQKHTLAPGTQVFMPPEALEDDLEVTYGITIDVFSLGCVCLHVMSMQWPLPKAVKHLDSNTGKIVALTELQRRENYLTCTVFQQFPTLRALVSQCLHDFPKERPSVGAVLEGLRTVRCDLVPHENDNIIQLCDSVASYKSLLEEKDKELAQKNEQLECKQKELNENSKQLDTARTQLALTSKKLTEVNEQLAMKDLQLKKQSKDQLLVESQVTNEEISQFFDDDKAEEEEEEEEEEEDESGDGRQRRYERDFFLSLQFLEQCKQRPPNLMNAEYIRKELPRPSEMHMRFDPGYYDNISSGIRRKGMPYPSSKKKIDLPTKELVELRKAEKRWVRPAKLEAELAQTEKETQELFRKFVGILNKLTPQKFETLANQALEMPIDSEDRLKGCIDRIFIKALEEPNYSVAYAQLCRVLSKVSVEVGTGPDVKKKTFRSLLLTKCQQEFEKDKESDKVIAELKQKVEEAAPEKKKQLEEELSEKEYRLRRNYLGNIKFIGELFKIKMLSEGIMHECIRRLLQSTTDEEALECFAKLMFTIGKDLDHEKGQALIKQYMDRVELIINAGKISSRIKFFLQDVVELRNANWVPRRENNNPKKIDQIHQEAKLEEAEKMRELTAHPPSIPMGGRQVSKGSLDMDSRKKNVKDGSSKMGGDWSSGSDKDKKPLSSQPKLDSTKFRNIKQTDNLLSFASTGKFGMRSDRESAATMDKSSRQESKGKPSRSSRSGSKRSDSRSGSISSGAGGPMMGSGQSQRNFAAPDKQRERQQALELAINMSGSSWSSDSSTHGVDIKRLMELLKSRDNANSEIMNCIEKEFPESRERSLIFSRDLGTALFKTVIDDSGSNAKYNEELFDIRITIVTKYIEPQNDSNHQRQLEFLYALQMVLHELEQPAGVATIICKKLSESGIIEDAAFHLWKKSGSETIGHDTTMLALKDFFDWLESTPVESDNSQ